MLEINKIILMGPVSSIGRLRHFEDGNSVIDFGVATHERWKPRHAGDPGESTDFHRVELRNQAALHFVENAIVGQQVYVEGKQRTRKWTDDNGQEVKLVYVEAYEFRLGVLPKLPSDTGIQADAADLRPRESRNSQAPQALRLASDSEQRVAAAPVVKPAAVRGPAAASKGQAPATQAAPAPAPAPVSAQAGRMPKWLRNKPVTAK